MSRANDRPSPADEFLAKLFGNIEELTGEDLDTVFRLVSHDTNPTATLRALAKKASREFRRRDEVPPPHVKAVLAGTLEGQNSKEGHLISDIIDGLLTPSTEPVRDIAFAYRGRSEAKLKPEDQKVVDSLEEELRQDWSEDE